jgi:MT-A70
VPSTQMRCMITASRRASATIAFFIPRCLAIFIAQALSQDHLVARTLAPGRRQVNYIASRKREHSRKPDELYPIIEACSPGPYLELFARGARPKWQAWGIKQTRTIVRIGPLTNITALS